MRISCFALFCAALYAGSVLAVNRIWVEAESFADKGGWVVDQQFMDIMGSPYLMAHGMGVPVADARTEVAFPSPGRYVLWIRTKDWAPFPTGPGRFQISVNSVRLERMLGSDGDIEWHWVRAGEIEAEAGRIEIALHDLSGFEGRCDVLFFVDSPDYTPPKAAAPLERLRRRMLSLPEIPPDAGEFDFVVAGGGMAGTCAALQAARLGLEVALIQNRPVLGGNNSSEVRVHLMGDWRYNHYPRLGRIVRELDNGDPGNAAVYTANQDPYGDRRKLDVVAAEPNISLFLNYHACRVEMAGSTLTALYARHIESGEELRFPAALFADCTGDGTIGFLAGADYRIGRESRVETGEFMAPGEADHMTMGMSNLWNATESDTPSTFQECPWALQFSEQYHLDMPRADWRWETGFGNFDMIADAEKIRDHNFRAIYGNWAFLKNHKTGKYRYLRLNWIAYISGKRESRRLLGDYILTQDDIEKRVIHDDGFVTTTWDLDLHFPDSTNSLFFPGQEFISWYRHPDIEPYPVPFRCLYSRNLTNLMMAGRNISVTHVALGTVRVMRTTGMMGEVLGYAAYLCAKHRTTPRGLHRHHLEEFKALLRQ